MKTIIAPCMTGFGEKKKYIYSDRTGLYHPDGMTNKRGYKKSELMKRITII